MRLSTSTNIMVFDQGKPRQITMEAATIACAKAGYKYVDANLCTACRTDQPLTQDNWEEWAHNLRKVADDHGVTFAQSHAYWTVGEEFNPDLSRTDGELGEELMRRSVLTSQILGTRWMVVHPYSIKKGQSWYHYRESFTYNREYFKRWGEYFADHNVGMAIENMARSTQKVPYCARGEELLALIDAIGNPMVQICIYTGHAHLSGINPADMIRLVGSHLKATHIADNHRNTDEHYAPFNGTIDWTDVMKALNEINYQEDFSFEIHNLTSMYPKQVQQKLVDFSYELGQYLVNMQFDK